MGFVQWAKLGNVFGVVVVVVVGEEGWWIGAVVAVTWGMEGNCVDEEGLALIGVGVSFQKAVGKVM